MKIMKQCKQFECIIAIFFKINLKNKLLYGENNKKILRFISFFKYLFYILNNKIYDGRNNRGVNLTKIFLKIFYSIILNFLTFF